MPHAPAGRTMTGRVARSLLQRQISNRDVYLSINQSINQSLFQAEAHSTNNKENANTGHRTEQTHRRIQVKKLRLKSEQANRTYHTQYVASKREDTITG